MSRPPTPGDAVRVAAASYLARGWVPVPVQQPTLGDPATGKRPLGSAWQNLRPTPAAIPQLFRGRRNVGVLLGEPSGGLLDVDLDCPEAVELAGEFLPPTPRRHGRGGIETHRWYRAADDPSGRDTYHGDHDTNPTKSETLVEIRGGDSRKGFQTVAPPSVHYSGERLVWTSCGEPAQVERVALQRAVFRLALACELIRRGCARPEALEIAQADPIPWERVPAGVTRRAIKWAPEELRPPRPKSGQGRRAPGAKKSQGGAQHSQERSPYTEAVLALANVDRVLQLVGLEPTDEGGRRTCPVHGGENPTSFATEGGDGTVWHCHSCLAGGDAIGLAAELRGLSRLEARDWLAAELGLDRDQLAQQEQRHEEETVPLLDVALETGVLPTKGEAAWLASRPMREPRARGSGGRVVQDRRPTGAGKTTGAGRTLHDGVREDGRTYLWASPSHELARAEVLPALAKAGCAIWDEDLDGGESGGVRPKLVALGAEVVPLGEPPANPGTPVAVKFAPFACPGPGVPGWSAETVEGLYQDAAARGWNPTATVCRACPRFLGEEGDPCPYWDRRRLAADADVLVVPHHGLKGDAKGRFGLVVDEDPASALVQCHEVDQRGARAFLILLDVALEQVAARAQTIREELEAFQIAEAHAGSRLVEAALRIGKLEEKLAKADRVAEQVLEQAEAVEAAVGLVVNELARWGSLGRGLLDVYALQRPERVDVAELEGLGELAKACESVLRRLAKQGEHLLDRSGTRVGGPANLLPFARELARHWGEGRPAILHVLRRQGGGLAAMLPVVEKLPKLPILALDATGDPALLSLATGRPVETVEGELTARLEGVHLVDVPCGRQRWRRGAQGKGRSGAQALKADVALIVRYARRVGAQRIGLVTFKDERPVIHEALGEAGFEVRSLHYGGEVGSNAFADWADLVVVAGTPFVKDTAQRLRAALEGASVEELLAEAAWERRRLPGGGTASVLVHPGEATRRAYAAMVRSRLEQSLGRAMRWDWTPRKGVLVLSEPWPTRHQLRLSTRHLECLEGDAAEAYDLLSEAGRLGDGSAPRERLAGGVKKLVEELGGASSAADLAGVDRATGYRWAACATLPRAELLDRLIDMVASPPASPPLQCHRGSPGRAPGGSPVTLGKNPRLEGQYGRGPLRHALTYRPSGFVTPIAPVEAPHMSIAVAGALSSLLRAPATKIDISPPHPAERKIDMAPSIPTEPSQLARLAVELAGGKTRNLQAELGFSPTTIRRWRNGSLKPGKKSLESLASFVSEKLREAAGEPNAPQRDPECGPAPVRPAGAPGGVRATDPRGEPPGTYPPSGCEACGGLVGPTRCWGPADKCATQTIPQADPAQPAADPGKNPASVSGSEPAQPADLPEEPPCCDGSGYVVAYADSIGPSIGECCPGCDRCEPDLADPQPLPELVEVPAGTQLPEGRIYAPALVPPEQAAKAKLPPAPPPPPTRREEVARGLEELRELAAKGQHPAWLRRAVERAKGLSSLCTWLGTRKVGEGRIVDQDLALERAQRMQAELGQGLYARRTWGHVVALLIRRGAQPRTPEGARAGEGYRGLKKQRGALRRARKAQATGGGAAGGAAAGGGLPDCKACGGSGRSSAGGACSPCRRRKARGPVTREPIVGAAAEALEARPVGRKERRS